MTRSFIDWLIDFEREHKDVEVRISCNSQIYSQQIGSSICITLCDNTDNRRIRQLIQVKNIRSSNLYADGVIILATEEMYKQLERGEGRSG